MKEPFVHENIKLIRFIKGMSQQEFADMLKIKRSVIGSYEEGRAKPKYALLTRLTKLFPVTIDELINEDLRDRIATQPNRTTPLHHDLRDYFAAKAMQALISLNYTPDRTDVYFDPDELATEAGYYADAQLKEREKE